MDFILMGARGRMGQAIIKCADELGAKCVQELGRDIKDTKEAKASLMIDFSLPESLDEVIRFCEAHGVGLVSGVTGYTDKDLEKLKELSKKLPVFWSPNMSLGVAVVKSMIAKLSAIKDWDYHLHEAHHINKIDRPSGTAKYLADAVSEATEKDCPVTDMRGGGVFGVHDVFAFSAEEEIQLSHRAYNRDVFAKGAVKAALWMQNKPAGFYRMDDITKGL
jgi:4-hydroxy-tetrahydrodipicolinate reductase